ncbi:ZIP family metal transporter [Candidatus Peregrinibacteria bacterium]|nr:ZIP family metal transporter [Candidatus Peregrinibacteria bacterium]
MNNVFLLTNFAAITAGIVTTIGIYAINRYAKWGQKNVVYFMSFAAGVLISVSFMHIIPESFKMNEYAPIALLAGFLFLYLLNRFLSMFRCRKKNCTSSIHGLIPVIGIGIHSFVDGIIYTVTFNVSIFTGVLAAIGMVLHEFPEGIISYLLLIKTNYKKKKASIYAFIAAAITTPLGAIISWPLINDLTKPMLGLLLSFSAGSLIYVGATHLLPEIQKKEKRFSLLALFVGIIVAIIIILSH